MQRHVFGPPSGWPLRRSRLTTRQWLWTARSARFLCPRTSRLLCRAQRSGSGQPTRGRPFSNIALSLIRNSVSLATFSRTKRVAYGGTDLLFLHRNYVAVALHSENPLSHKFGGSVLAAYRCATRMCFALRDLYRLHPKTVGGMWYFWSGIFSACVSPPASLHRPACWLMTCGNNIDRSRSYSDHGA